MTPADILTLAAVVVTVLALTLAAIILGTLVLTWALILILDATTPTIHRWNEKEK